MTYLVLGFTGFIVLVYAIVEIFLPKYIHFVIPLLFLAALGAIYKSTDFIGYAVDSSFIPDGKEAIVLYQSKNDPFLYFTVFFKGEHEPRLVKMKDSEDNDQESKKSQNSNEPMIIRFGKKLKSGSGDGHNHEGDEDDSFELIPFSESNIGSKE